MFKQPSKNTDTVDITLTTMPFDRVIELDMTVERWCIQLLSGRVVNDLSHTTARLHYSLVEFSKA